MRNTIDIIPNPNLKGLNSNFTNLPGLQPDSIVKLTQGSSFVYTRYSRPSQQSSSQNKVELPASLCQLNSIHQGSVIVEPVFNVSQCRRLTVYVSDLDWKIVNNKANRLQEEFMSQADIVWNGARLPLFYDKANFVTLRVQFQGGLGVLVENSELEVLVQGDSFADKNEENMRQEYFTHKIMVLPSSFDELGNINRVFLPADHQCLKQNKKQSKKQNREQQKQKTKQIESQAQKQRQNIAIDTNNYNFQIKYRQIGKNKNKEFPCDTNILTIKQQIASVKLMKNDKIQKQGKKDKILVVQVSVVDDYGDFMKIGEDKIGKEFRIVEVEEAEQGEQGQSMGIQDKGQDQENNILRYETHRPKQQQTKISKNAIIISDTLLRAYDIDIESPITLIRNSKSRQASDSKKLDFLLNKAGFRINVAVSEKHEEKLTIIKQIFINSFVKQLVQGRKNIQQHFKQQVNKNNITVYGRFPYLMKQEQNIKFSYIRLEQNQVSLSDPLTIIYCPPKKDKKKQQPHMMREGQSGMSQQIESLKQKLQKIVTVENYFYQDLSSEDVKGKIAMLGLLDALMVKNNNNVNNSNDQKYKQQVFVQLYKVCYQEQIATLLKFLSEQHSDSIQNIPNVLITSISNNGKTVMNNIIRQHGFETLYVDMSQMDDITLNLLDLNQYLELMFQIYKGELIFMDNLDSVCYQIDEGDLHRRQERIAAKILTRNLMDYCRVYKKRCIFTAKNEGNIEAQFTNYQLIKLKNPSRETRLKVLKGYNNRNQNQVNQQILNIEQIVQNSESMSFGEFSKYAISGHLQQGDKKKQNVLDFSRLAGIRQAKKILRTIVQRPLKYSFIFKKLPIKLSRGVLLYGGSGTGKSAIGEALAGEFKMKFFSVKGSDILSKYIGGSEAAVRDVFEKAMSVSPSIVFFDQFQSIVPKRNASNTGVTDRVVNQFLCYLDGVASVEGVFIVAASSRPQLIDPALLRPGRIDTHIFLDYPTKQERSELLQLYKNSIYFESPRQEIIQKTEDYSYSDLIGLINQLRIKKSAKIIKQHPNLDQQSIKGNQFKHIQKQFFEQILSTYRISISKKEKEKERNNFLKFKNGQAPDIKNQKSVLK